MPDSPMATLASPELAALCQRHHVRSLDLFGSATTDQFDPSRSDLDFLVRFEDVPEGQSVNTYFAFKHSLELLLQRPVDLVEASRLENPFFRHQVLTTKKSIYAS